MATAAFDNFNRATLDKFCETAAETAAQRDGRRYQSPFTVLRCRRSRRSRRCRRYLLLALVAG